MNFRKTASVLVALSLMLCVFSQYASSMTVAEDFSAAAGEAAKSAAAAVLYDRTGKQLLFSKNADEKRAAGSLVKLVTAVTALKYLPGNTVFTVGSELELVKPNSSLCFIYQGQRLSLEQLVYAMLLPSGNDAAYTVAVNTAKLVSKNSALSDTAAVSYFCGLMNSRAKEIGAQNSHFVNPEGWDAENQYTTAADLAKICAAALENDIISTAVACQYKELYYASGEKNAWKNSNRMLDLSSPYYYKGAVGIKTGTTDAAGRCLAASAVKNSKQLIAVVLGCETDEARYGAAAGLLNAGFMEPPRGDYSGDFRITAADARYVLRAAVGLEANTPVLLKRCDIDSDGILSASDARSVLRIAVGLDAVG